MRDTRKGIEMNPENALENQLMVDRISYGWLRDVKL